MQKTSDDFARVHEDVLAMVDAIASEEPKGAFDRLLESADGVDIDEVFEDLRLPVEDLVEAHRLLLGPAKSNADVVALAARIASDEGLALGSQRIACAAGLSIGEIRGMAFVLGVDWQELLAAALEGHQPALGARA